MRSSALKSLEMFFPIERIARINLVAQIFPLFIAIGDVFHQVLET
jgi:hypothetical protein